ncbi:uncharacterized protein LOC108337023 [Vigna angularis]|nr:uncharacterized protein LOC108337023 [Vigna angularis]
MENQKSGSKLTRTHSSLLSCSSPAIRSSIHSLSSIVTKEEHELQEQEKLLLDVDDDKNNKPKKPQARTRPRAQAHRSSAYSALAVFFLGACSLLFYFFYLEVSSSENVLLALIFVAVALYFVSKNKGLIQRSFSAAKHSWEENVKRLGFSKAVALNPNPKKNTRNYPNQKPQSQNRNFKSHSFNAGKRKLVSIIPSTHRCR